MLQRNLLSSFNLFVFLSVLLILTSCRKHGGIPATLSVSPTTDTIGGIITITGNNFSTVTSDNIVQFNDSITGTVLSATSTQLTVRVPSNTTKGRIIVKTNGQVWQTAQDFVIAPKFNPQTAAPGYPVTIITGGNISLSDYIVQFNGAGAKLTGLIAAPLTAIVPDGATSGPVTVLFKGEPYTSLINFTVAPLGQVSTFATGFNSPLGMVFDDNNNLFVADIQGGVIKKITPDGSVSTYAGNGTYSSTDGPLLSAGLFGPTNLAFAPNGDMYVTQQWDNKIRKISSGSVSTFTNGAGPASSTVFMPIGICIDASGNLYVGDNTFMQIKKVTPAGVVSIIAGKGTQGAADGAAADALFIGPQSLLFDATGNLIIADGDHIRQLGNGMVSTFAGSYRDFKDGLGINACFNQPANIAKDAAGNIYVADRANQVIRRITPAGAVTTIAGAPGQKGNQDGTGVKALFNNPAGIAVDKNGVIYVSDQGNGTIRKITLR